jgi:hypothetical protein
MGKRGDQFFASATGVRLSLLTIPLSMLGLSNSAADLGKLISEDDARSVRTST